MRWNVLSAGPVLLLFFLSACEPERFQPEIEEWHDQSQTTAATPPPESLRLLDLVNDLRQSGCRCGSAYMPPVPVLSWQADLQLAAERHARDMARRAELDHTGSDGSDVAGRVSDTGYPWRTVGENIAWGYRTADSVFDGWRGSPGHCRNLMQAGFRHMGLARSGTYWVQTLAQPMSN